MSTYMIKLTDVAGEARAMFGDQADYVAGRKLPDHDWRFEIIFESGAQISMNSDADATQVAAAIDREKSR